MSAVEISLFIHRHRLRTPRFFRCLFFQLSHLVQDGRGRCGPEERFGMAVVVRDVVCNRANQVWHSAQRAPANPLASSEAELVRRRRLFVRR